MNPAVDGTSGAPPPGGQPPPPGQAPPSPPWNTAEFHDREDQNLVPLIEQMPEGQKWLEKMAKTILDDKKEDEDSSKEYQERTARAVELYMSMSSTFESGPAEGAFKPNMPLLAKIARRITAHTLSVVQNSEPIGVPTGDEDQDRAMRIAKYITWERRAKHPEWKLGMALTVLMWAVQGSVVRRVVFDPIRRKKRYEVLIPGKNFFIPYTDQDYTPNFEDTERTTQIINIPKWRLKKLGRLGHFANVDKLFDPNAERKPQTVDLSKEPSEIEKVVQEALGMQPNSQAKGKQYRLLERHSWEELPGDEEPHRVAITMEESTKRILRVVLLERENRMDRLRFDNETQLVQAEVANGKPPREIPPPVTDPVYQYTHYVFSPNPSGAYGLGVWVFLGGLNELSNELAGEDILARRLANVAGMSGFMTDNIEVPKGEIRMEFARFKQIKLNSPGEPIGNHIFTMPFQPPRGGAMEWIDKIDQEGQSVMSSSDYQSGMPGPSHETAAAAKLRVAAGNNAVTQAIETFLIPLACEYKQEAYITAAHMDPTEYFLVEEPNPTAPGQTQRVPMEITPADFIEDFDITFDSDVRLKVDPGLGENAVTAYQMVTTDPDLAGDPNIRNAARRKALKALECPDLARMLPEQIPPPPPPTPMSQEQENAGFMNEEDHPVLDDDPHEDHDRKMTEFRANGLFDQLTPTGKQLFERHERKHKSILYLMATQMLGGALPASASDLQGNQNTPAPAGAGAAFDVVGSG